MTVEYLLNRTYPVRAGQTILFWAAAGGVGLLAGQWAKSLAARAIGIVGSQDKCALALQHGYSEVIDYSRENVVERVQQLTDGNGVSVVYDSVGKASFERSIDCLAPRGLFISFGNTSGDPPDVPASLLQQKGSLYFTRPTLVTYTATRDELEASARQVFDKVADGTLKLPVNQSYALADAVQAHRDLEARKTTGSTVLTP
jgi:NADPH2:quinone reductase